MLISHKYNQRQTQDCMDMSCSQQNWKAVYRDAKSSPAGRPSGGCLCAAAGNAQVSALLQLTKRALRSTSQVAPDFLTKPRPQCVSTNVLICVRSSLPVVIVCSALCSVRVGNSLSTLGDGHLLPGVFLFLPDRLL